MRKYMLAFLIISTSIWASNQDVSETKNGLDNFKYQSLQDTFESVTCALAEATQRELGDMYFIDAGNGVKTFTAKTKEGAISQAICDVLNVGKQVSQDIAVKGPIKIAEANHSIIRQE